MLESFFSIGAIGGLSGVETEEEANSLLWRYVTYIIKERDITWEKAEEIALYNIGYFSGCYDRETQQRIFKLFKTEHPIFGTKEPTPQEALTAGMKLAEDHKKQLIRETTHKKQRESRKS